MSAVLRLVGSSISRAGLSTTLCTTQTWRHGILAVVCRASLASMYADLSVPKMSVQAPMSKQTTQMRNLEA